MNDEESNRTPWILAWATGWLVVTFFKMADARKSKCRTER